MPVVDEEELPPAVDAERIEFDSESAGELSMYVGGEGPPLLLIHSVNAAASAAEVRPLFQRHRSSRTVFALDLPGFGFSERSDRVYTPRLMTDALHAAVQQIKAWLGAATPIDALALSTSAEFLARAAAESPAAFRSVALISPTGFSGRRARRGPPGSTRFMPWLYRVLRGPGWGRALYRTLTRPSVIRYFLQRTWGRKEIDETLFSYDVLTSRQPGAEYAPLYFLSGAFFSADIHDVYDALSMPVWMTECTRGDFTNYRGAAFLADRPNWSFSTFPTGALPFFEVPDAFAAAYYAFVAKLPSSS